MIIDALSCKSFGSLAHFKTNWLPLLLEIRSSRVELVVDDARVLLATRKIRPILIEKVKEAQNQDEKLSKINNEVRDGTRIDFSLSKDTTLMFGDRLCVPKMERLKRGIMEEAHCSTYSIHSCSTKMYIDLRENYWWLGIKKK